MMPRFPIYIVSKGRWEARPTVRSLEEFGIPYLIVVEEQEAERYAKVIPLTRILILDRSYQQDYDTFDSIGDTKSKGPGPARNFVWDHAIRSGSQCHWVMDDNIHGFFRLQDNLKAPSDGTSICCMEDFATRFSNVAMAGPNYFKFLARKSISKPLAINTRIYSCNLIRNDAPFRWRGRYNEDTDLSLRMLKAGWCTIQFNAFLQDKATTQMHNGGNTEAFYAKDGTLPKSKMLVAMHPDVSKLTWKFGRWHHEVNYKGFKQKLILKPSVTVPKDPESHYGFRIVPRVSKRRSSRSIEANL